MRGDNVQDLNQYGPLMLSAAAPSRLIADVNTDQQNSGLQTMVQYDRDTAARFGISSQLIDNVLYDAFGQRQVSTMYTSLNQYHVVMEAAPRFWQDPGVPEADLCTRRPAAATCRSTRSPVTRPRWRRWR